MRAILLALLALPGVAFGADHEVSLELGYLQVSDPALLVFGSGPGLGSWGLRGGYAVHDRVALVGSWHHGGRGADVSSAEGAASFRAALRTDTFRVGVKADPGISEIAQPYASLLASVIAARAQLDGDPDTPYNPDQHAYSAPIAGGEAVGGFELRIPVDALGPVAALGVSVEAGYGLYGAGQLGTLGTLRPGGLVVRGGAGLRF